MDKLTEQIAEMYSVGKMSMPDIALKVGVSYSTVRYRLVKNGVPLRTQSSGQIESGKTGGAALKGKPREPFSDEWKQNIKHGRLKWGEENAAGVSVKPSGYVEYTRGPNKGRSIHVVKMEERIGRHLYPDELVHHIDRDRSNNDDNNLALVTKAGHGRLHRFEDQLAGKIKERSQDGRFS